MNKNKVKDIFLNGRLKVGEVGIEIEAEFDNFNAEVEVPPGWLQIIDGSLREGYEYVLRQPSKRENVHKYLDSIYKYFVRNLPKVSDNCSTHVHVNVQRLTVDQLVNFISLYFILEPALINICGEHRKGNLFCLSASNCEHQYTVLESVAQGSSRLLQKNEIKYGALNLAAIATYGSLEFRAMRFPVSKEILTSWIHLLLEIKDSANSIKNKVDILMRFSELGIEDFIKKYLPTSHAMLTLTPSIKYEMTEAMSLVQKALYTEYKDID